jgi:hypothetical protein
MRLSVTRLQVDNDELLSQLTIRHETRLRLTA